MLRLIQKDIEKAKNQLKPWSENFMIYFCKPKNWDYYYLENINGYFVLYYLDERGGKNIISKTQNYDFLKYKCFELLVQFCSYKYVDYILKNESNPTSNQLELIREKQNEFMKIIAP